MSNDKHRTDSSPNRDPVDGMLADWKESLKCSDAQLQSMLSNVLPNIDCPDEPTHISRRTFVRHGPLIVFCSLAAALLIAIGLWQLSSNYTSTPQQSQVYASLQRIAFSTQELQRDRTLACEVARLFEKPVLVRKHDSNFDIEDDPYLADAMSVRVGSSRVLLRFVAQELTESQSWKDIGLEEVIGGREQQLQVLILAASSVKYWSHLLPDNSLWVELHVEADGALNTNQPAHQLKANEPKVVWESHGSDCTRRLVMVFELLPVCDFGEVL